MAMAKPLAEIATMTFERALKELESIVERHEKGAVELEEMIAIYERGEALRGHCVQLLKRAETRFEQLTVGEEHLSALARMLEEIKDKSFERAIKELESITERVEKGAVELEESIVIFERGGALREHCARLLKQAEARVEKLTLTANGTPTGAEPFRPQE